MKKFITILLAAGLLTGLASCGNKTAENDAENTAGNIQETSGSDLDYIKKKGKMVIGITEYEPMNYKDENGEWTGFDTEFAQAVAKELGVEAEFIVIEWDNKIMELDSKAIDSVWNGMTITDEVKKGMSCTDPYVVNAQVVVADKSKIDSYKSVEDLADVSFVAEAGSAGEKAITEAGYECTEVGSQSDALLEVSSGAADACVIDITMAKAMTGEGTSYESLASGLSLTSEEYGIGFRKDSDVTAAVNDIIKKFKEDGTLASLAEKYNLTIAE